MTACSRASRRAFLRFLTASPVVAITRAQESVEAGGPKDVLSVRDFEELAHRRLPPAHWGFLASGVDDDLTLQANLEAFKHIGLRPKRLVDVSAISTQVDIFGIRWDSPIYISAIGPLGLFDSGGELTAARAARAKNTLQMLAQGTSYSIEDVTQTLGRPPWYQLYLPLRWNETERLLRRVEATGCQVLVWTVDWQGGRNLETANRFALMDKRNCASCHDRIKSPMTRDIEGGLNMNGATWRDLDHLRSLTKMKIVIKGLDTAEDAKMALERGADGVVVSNHGGRELETLRATIDCLPEVVSAIGGRIPVFIDGGFRRGSDVYKALAMGARAIGIGRPYVYGLAAFGQAGVERVLDIMNAELALTMRQCGAGSLAKIPPFSAVVLNASH